LIQPVLRELNRSGAALLGWTRFPGAVVELPDSEGATILRAMLGASPRCDHRIRRLALRSTPDGETRCMPLACLDPAGGGYLIGLMGSAEDTGWLTDF